ncbi:MAG: 23S rRNA (pseudouridine(1915)-N(3))-methyltransferase RlmH [Actinomycetota bacterium]|nr:23S rRNA (pseudouridine(1915)-N(3))-methyltransferase RlmH [Actinomycetota bacterium]
MRVIVLAVGRLRPPYVDDVQHYAKLLTRYARLELVEVREAVQVPGRMPQGPAGGGPGPFISLLHAGGESFSSRAFAAFLEQRRRSGRDLCFVVGGAYGLGDLDAAEHRFSLGPMTLPHQLARVVLLEQLYRGHKILAGEPYHH